VVTGDLTEKGLLEEFEGVAELLKGINSKTICLMGNHDARNVGFMHFQARAIYINRQVFVV